MKCVVLVSGGMDSVTALHHAARDHELAGAVSFDYGSKHNARELESAVWQCGQFPGLRHDIVEMPFINRLFQSDLLASGGEIPEGHYAEETMRRTVVPFRNGIMLAIACGIAESRGAEALVIAAHGGDHAIYPDCREPFMQAMADAMREGSYAGIELLRPFIDWTKADIARRGAALGVDFSRTWSCYKGGHTHCGVCGTCVERREAFLLAGVPDLTPYLSQPPLPPAPASAS
jgi:7-cyano-7-deazaguanine synthase